MPDTSFIESAAAYCRKLTERSSSNFYYAFLFLPPRRRQALEAVYAYCRLVDDVVDEEAPAADKLAGLARWRGELDQVFAPGGAPAHPVSARLAEAVRRFAIRRADMEAVIDGCAMDIDQARYATWDELETYCYRVASAVGLMCIEIFGHRGGPPPRYQGHRVVEPSGPYAYAVHLGMALQLTNILRDVAEDAQRGRIYLPAEALAAAGVSEADLTAGVRTPGFLALMRAVAARARGHYLAARRAISAAERRELVIAEIMGDIYYALLERLEETGFAVFGDKVKVTRGKKMAIALRTFATAKLALY
jgi:phytoene synthase